MSEKKNLIIRIDTATHKALARWAADDFRSLNGQIEYILNNALNNANRLKTKQNKISESKKETQKEE